MGGRGVRVCIGIERRGGEEDRNCGAIIIKMEEVVINL